MKFQCDTTPIGIQNIATIKANNFNNGLGLFDKYVAEETVKHERKTKWFQIKSFVQVVLKGLKNKSFWLSFIMGNVLLIINEFFFEPAIDQFWQGSLMMTLSSKIVVDVVVVRPLGNKIESRISILKNGKIKRGLAF